MKVIVTGATGNAGGGIVKACLADDRITKVLILTRRNVASDIESHPKIQVVMHRDFSAYPDELIQHLEGAEACIWAIGGRVEQFGGDMDMARRVGVEYTCAGAKAMRDKLAPRVPEGKRFRFVFCSGDMAEWDQGKRLLFLENTRKIKGSVEKALCELADEDKAANFEVWIGRPSYIIPANASAVTRLFSPFVKGITTEQLGRALVRMAVEGAGERIVPTGTLQKM